MTIIAEIGIVVIGVAILLGILTGGRIYTSLWNRAKVKAEEAAEAARDPIADGKVAIADAKREHEQMKQYRRSLVEQITHLKAERQIHQATSNKYEQLAKAAGAAKNREDVTTALTEKGRADTDIANLDKVIEQHEKLASDMETKVTQRGREIAEAERNQKYHITSLKFAEMREKNERMLANFSGTNSALARIEQDARNAEVRATVLEEENRNSTPLQSLDEKYLTTSNGPSDADIAKYMGEEEPTGAEVKA